MPYGPNRVGQIFDRLDKMTPSEVAEEVGCSLRNVNNVKGQLRVHELNYKISILQQQLAELHQRVLSLEGIRRKERTTIAQRVKEIRESQGQS
jgi:predicted DNA-binding ribbon-helix-helix protein